MNTIKQTLKISPLTKLLIIFGLVLGLWIFFLGAGTADAASKQAENACRKAATRISDFSKSKAFQNNFAGCYYGYDTVGSSQNASKKCANRYSTFGIYGACVTGASYAKRAATRPPPIERCNQDNAQRQRECRRKYQQCDELAGPGIKKAIVDCKRERIKRFGPGGGGGGGGGSGARSGRGNDPYRGRHLCGNIRDKDGKLSKDNYLTKFNFGCVGEKGPKGLNPIEDLAFAFLRFLSVGVGIAVVIAVVGSGLQYISSEGNAEVTTKAKKRIRSALIGLVLYIFAFSLFQYLVPGGLFWPGSWLDIELVTRLLL